MHWMHGTEIQEIAEDTMGRELAAEMALYRFTMILDTLLHRLP